MDENNRPIASKTGWDLAEGATPHIVYPSNDAEKENHPLHLPAFPRMFPPSTSKMQMAASGFRRTDANVPSVSQFMGSSTKTKNTVQQDVYNRPEYGSAKQLNYTPVHSSFNVNRGLQSSSYEFPQFLSSTKLKSMPPSVQKARYPETNKYCGEQRNTSMFAAHSSVNDDKALVQDSSYELPQLLSSSTKLKSMPPSAQKGYLEANKCYGEQRDASMFVRDHDIVANPECFKTPSSKISQHSVDPKTLSGHVASVEQEATSISPSEQESESYPPRPAFWMDKSHVHVQAPLSSTKPIVNSITKTELHSENKAKSYYSTPSCRTRTPPIVRKMNKVTEFLQRMPLTVDSNPDDNSDEDEEEEEPRGSSTSREYSDTLKQDEPDRPSYLGASIQTSYSRSKTALSTMSCSVSQQKKTDGLADEQKSIYDAFKPLPQDEDDIHGHGCNRKDLPDAGQASWKGQNKMPEAPLPDLKQLQINPADLLKKLQFSNDHQIIEVNGKEYYILNMLGKGGSSKVYQVYDTKKSIFAIKKVYLDEADESTRKGFINEITLLRKLQNSEWVVKMYDYEYRESENRLLVVMEKGDTDMASVLHSNTKSKQLSPVQTLFYFSQMLQAVADLHKAGIIHLDLKPSNFLLVAGKIKLIDFGIASIVPKDVTSVYKDSQVGTLNFMSPEAILDIRSSFEPSGESGDSNKPVIKISPKSDVWSLGCILYNLVYGRTPFQHITNPYAKVQAIVSAKHQIAFPEIKDIQLLDILKSCLQRDPKQRPSVQELMKHPYVASQIQVSGTTSSSPPISGTPGLHSIIANLQSLTPRRIQQVAQVVANLTSSKQTRYSNLSFREI